GLKAERLDLRLDPPELERLRADLRRRGDAQARLRVLVHPVEVGDRLRLRRDALQDALLPELDAGVAHPLDHDVVALDRVELRGVEADHGGEHGAPPAGESEAEGDLALVVDRHVAGTGRAPAELLGVGAWRDGLDLAVRDEILDDVAGAVAVEELEVDLGGE